MVKYTYNNVCRTQTGGRLKVHRMRLVKQYGLFSLLNVMFASVKK